jgi:hypothetical protein
VAAKVGACRALAELAPALPKPALQPALPGVYSGLLALLRESTEETAHLVLGTLAALVQVRPPAPPPGNPAVPCWALPFL